MCVMAVHVPKTEDEAALGGPKFHPPLYKQRYNAVLEVARRLQAKRIIDMGCSGCKLVKQLKREPYTEEVVGVDVDGVELNMCSPPYARYTESQHRTHLHSAAWYYWASSIAAADARLVDFDLLACVEVIEHLDPPVLAKVPEVVFGILQPKTVVVTTPNAEFNVLFPKFSGFRHPDHRFEWTREEMQSWCYGICERYQYTVELSGVGSPPADSGHLGHCSQMAVFSRRQRVSYLSAVVGTPYKIIADCAHPYERNPLSPSERLSREVEYYLGVLMRRMQDGDEEEEDSDLRRGFGQCEISQDAQGSLQDGEPVGSQETDDDVVLVPLEDVLVYPRVKSLCSSVEDIRSALQRHSRIVELNSLGTHAVYRHGNDEDLESEGEDDAPDKNNHCLGNAQTMYRQGNDVDLDSGDDATEVEGHHRLDSIQTTMYCQGSTKALGSGDDAFIKGTQYTAPHGGSHGTLADEPLAMGVDPEPEWWD